MVNRADDDNPLQLLFSINLKDVEALTGRQKVANKLEQACMGHINKVSTLCQTDSFMLDLTSF
jgi:hypothetical protein